MENQIERNNSVLKRKAVKQKVGLLLFVVVLVFTVIASYFVNTYVLPYAFW